MAASTMELLRALELEQPDVQGFSLGGMVALALAAEYSADLGAVVSGGHGKSDGPGSGAVELLSPAMAAVGRCVHVSGFCRPGPCPHLMQWAVLRAAPMRRSRRAVWMRCSGEVDLPHIRRRRVGSACSASGGGGWICLQHIRQRQWQHMCYDATQSRCPSVPFTCGQPPQCSHACRCHFHAAPPGRLSKRGLRASTSCFQAVQMTQVHLLQWALQWGSPGPLG